MKVDKSVINFINKRNVLDLIRNNGPISKTELAQLTSLSLPTIMKIVDELMEKGIVLDSGLGVSTGGKPPKMVEFNVLAHTIIGVDINEYRIDVIVMDMAANIVCERVRDISEHTDSGKMIFYLKELLWSVIRDPAVDPDKLLGIGLGFGGLIDRGLGKVIYSPIFGWRNVDILSPLQKEFSIPIIVDNGTRAMAMGEKLVGHARDVENFICINYGYEIDAAIVINGSLYYGVSSMSGSLGHVPVTGRSVPCDCGGTGCLNAVATSRALEVQARQTVAGLRRGEGSQILDMAYGHIDRITIYTVIEAAENGDLTALRILRQAAEYVSRAVVGLMSIFDPELIILDGKLPRSSRVFMEELRRRIEGRRASFTHETLQLEFSNLGKHMGAIGAASFILSEFIEKGGLIQPET